MGNSNPCFCISLLQGCFYFTNVSFLRLGVTLGKKRKIKQHIEVVEVKNEEKKETKKKKMIDSATL
jgi:hypothetical protein